RLPVLPLERGARSRVEQLREDRAEVAFGGNEAFGEHRVRDLGLRLVVQLDDLVVLFLAVIAELLRDLDLRAPVAAVLLGGVLGEGGAGEVGQAADIVPRELGNGGKYLLLLGGRRRRLRAHDGRTYRERGRQERDRSVGETPHVPGWIVASAERLLGRVHMPA